MQDFDKQLKIIENRIEDIKETINKSKELILSIECYNYLIKRDIDEIKYNVDKIILKQ